MYIQIGEQVVYLDNEQIVASERRPKFQSIIIKQGLQNEFLHSISKDEIGDHWENELGKLELLSLLGNKRAWHILQNYEEFKGAQTDGVIAQQWKDAIANVTWILNK